MCSKIAGIIADTYSNKLSYSQARRRNLDEQLDNLAVLLGRRGHGDVLARACIPKCYC